MKASELLRERIADVLQLAHQTYIAILTNSDQRAVLQAALFSSVKMLEAVLEIAGKKKTLLEDHKIEREDIDKLYREVFSLLLEEGEAK